MHLCGLHQELHLWDLKAKELVRVFAEGPKQTRYIVRACMGGPAESIIASGSEGK